MSDQRSEQPAVLESADERVLLLVAGERDRDLLADRLAERYEVVDGDPDDFGRFDLCIVDAPTYRRAAEDISALRGDTETYLPVLLLVEDRQRVREAEWLAEEVGGTVDDVLVIPTPKHELDARVEALLRARRQSQRLALFRRAMDEATVGISITNPTHPENPLVYVNDGFCRLTGYDREEVLGRNCRFLQGPDTEEATVDRIRAAIDAEEPVTVELLNYRADGEPFWNLLTVAPVRDDGGGVTHYLGFQRDITERIRREQEVRRERERFEALARTATDAILVVDADGVVRYANPAVEQVFGYDPEAVEGRPLTKLMPEEYQAAHHERFGQYLEAGERHADRDLARFSGRHADGHEVPLEVSVAEFEGPDGPLFAGIVRDVTEQEELQSELRGERELLEGVFQTSPVGIVVVGADDDILRANRAAEAELGLERSEIVSRTYADPDWEAVDVDGEPIPDEDLPAGRVLRTGEPVEDYRHGVRTDGETRWISVNAAPMTDEDGAVEAVVTSVEDITDRLERERELERYETLVETMEDAALIYDEDKRLRFVNDALREALSASRENIEGSHLSEFGAMFADTETLEAYEAVIDDLLAGRRTEAEMDVEFVLPDGNAVTNIALAPVPGEDGPSGVVAVARDVTDRVQRERELERYETIVESTLDLIYVVDPDGRFIRVNDAIVEASDYDREKLLGSHASLVADERTVDHMESLVRELLREGREQTFTEASMVFADGTRREYVCSLSVLRDDDGEFQGTVIVAHDVTDLRDHKRRLSVLDRVLRHNLRNRMNVILGYAGELTDHSDPAVAEFGAEIEDSAADLLELSESARRFESVISGEAEATRSVDVVGLLKATAKSVRAEHPGVTVSLDAPEAAPVRAHETFELAVEELLENAVRHDDPAGLAVEMSVSVGDDDVEVRVTDDGPTLPEVYRRALSAGTESPLEHTQGLGLWLVRWTAESLDGEFRVEARDPQGTVITLSLPRPGE